MAHDTYPKFKFKALRAVAVLPLVFFASGCVETSGMSGGLTAPTATAVGQDNTGDTVSVALRSRSDGNQTVTLSGGLDYTCTGVLDEAPSARGSELINISCTDGSNGTATLVYNASAQPSQFVFSRPGQNAGSLTF